MNNLLFLYYLRTEYARRLKQNPRYSLRAFALALQVEHSSMIQILKGKRRLTDSMCLKLGKKLKFSEEKMRFLMWHHSIEKVLFSDTGEFDVEAMQNEMHGILAYLERSLSSDGPPQVDIATPQIQSMMIGTS